MSIPSSVDPYLEPEAESRRSPGWWIFASRVPALMPAAAVTTAVVLWDDIARRGLWPRLPGPFQPLGPDVDIAGAWVLCAVGVIFAVGARIGRRGGPAASEPVTLPRLPVFLRFDGRPVLVVGGGSVAAAKIPALLDAGAAVTVVAPTIAPSIDRSRVRAIEREFQAHDLDGMWFATAAGPPETNRAVREAAESRAVFVNAVDDSANATAYLGGAIARAGVTVAVSTAGRAPALAGLLREALDELIPQDIDGWVEEAHALSLRQRAANVPMAERRPQLLEALNRRYERRATTSHPQ